ncbi:MAG: TIR domain-containing protein [Proteobacteria bacterium]|nr:TIR domain-containing protein [Pseudomonadota bacterium]
MFLSYASQDSEAATQICEALRSAGIEVWFDKSELRGGDRWDHQIREQINTCRLFIPVISANTESRDEGYFRREWGLAVDRTRNMAAKKAFLLPVVIDGTPETGSSVPEQFQQIQWTRLLSGQTPPAFTARVAALLSPPATAAVSGSKLEPEIVPPRGRASSHTVWRPIGVLAIALLIIAVWLAWQRLSPSQHVDRAGTAKPQTPITEKSIAVLPFVDMSEKHDQEYFADGMAEEIIDLLAKVPDLHVPARTSSFYFKDKATKVPDIARELSVANVLEGSVRASGNRLRVTAQLVRADTGFHVWSQTYDRELSEIFKVQDDIANAVVQALQITLMGGPLTRAQGGTENLEAYQLYLRGLSASRNNTNDSLLRAQDYFNQAIKLDPAFGLAWVELSRATGLLTDNGALTQKEGYERAREQSLRALQLSPKLAEAHALLSYFHRAYDYDWPAAAAEAASALALDPTNPTALMASGGVASTLGHGEEAIRQQKVALVRDPLFPLLHWYLGYAQYSANRLHDAEVTFRKLLVLAPEFAWTRVYLAKTLLAEGKADAALSVMMQENDDHERWLMLSMAHHAMGRDLEARQELKAYVEKYSATDAYWVAMAYAQRGENDRAFQWLDRAYQQRDSSLPEITGEHLFKPIDTDPRFKVFLRKMRLPD